MFVPFTLAIILGVAHLGSASQCSVNSGFDYSSGANDMLQQTVDLGGCCDLCTVTSGCKAFVWNIKVSRCYLKSGYGGTVANADVVYGFPSNSTNQGSCSACTPSCPPGWKGPTSTLKCYQVPAQIGNPVNGNQICGATPGAQLGSVKTQDESNFVKNNLITDAGGDWLVTNGRYNGNSWYWADSPSGSPLMYSDWGTPSSQTANPTSANVYLYLFPAGNGVNTGKFWADQSVNHRLLCELSVANQCTGRGSCGGC